MPKQSFVDQLLLGHVIRPNAPIADIFKVSEKSLFLFF